MCEQGSRQHNKLTLSSESSVLGQGRGVFQGSCECWNGRRREEWEEILCYQAGGEGVSFGDYKVTQGKLKKNKFQDIRYEILKYFEVPDNCYTI